MTVGFCNMQRLTQQRDVLNVHLAQILFAPPEYSFSPSCLIINTYAVMYLAGESTILAATWPGSMGDPGPVLFIKCDC